MLQQGGYQPYNPGDCPTSESVHNLRNKLSSMWDGTANDAGYNKGWAGLQQTKSCSNLRNMLQEHWAQGYVRQQQPGMRHDGVVPSVSVNNMKNMFDSGYSSLPASQQKALDEALASDPERRKTFTHLMRLLESGASTLDREQQGSAYSELESLRQSLRLRNLDDAPGADHTSFERERQSLRQELEAVRVARGTIDKELIARLVSGEERRMQQQQYQPGVGSRIQAELEAVRARRKAAGGGSLDALNDWHEHNYQEQKDRIQMELEALRGRVKSTLLKIEQGEWLTRR